jgi:hypothetical protein
MQTVSDTGAGASRVPPHEPTSAVLARLIEDVPPETVNLTWLMGRLEQRSFGFLMLVIALVGLMPVIATVATILLPFLAFQMMLGRKNPSLPRFLADRSISSRHFTRAIARLIPFFRRMEMFVRPRWRTPFDTTERFIGFIVLVLAITTVAPFPFYILPMLAILLIAFAYLEEDGLLLCVALLAALLAIAFMTATVLATVKAAGFIGRLWARI